MCFPFYYRRYLDVDIEDWPRHAPKKAKKAKKMQAHYPGPVRAAGSFYYPGVVAWAVPPPPPPSPAAVPSPRPARKQVKFIGHGTYIADGKKARRRDTDSSSDTSDSDEDKRLKNKPQKSNKFLYIPAGQPGHHNGQPGWRHQGGVVDGEYHNYYYGRSGRDVQQDNMEEARKQVVFKPNDMVPQGADPNQQFWVREIDGKWNLRNFYTIQNALQPGKWDRDPVQGYLWFQRHAK